MQPAYARPIRSAQGLLSPLGLSLLLLVLSTLPWLSSANAQTVVPDQELYRIRVLNANGGAVEVSADRGANWMVLGKVIRPATALAPGFAASRWAPAGSVAAVAVHGVRVKVRAAGPGDPKHTSKSMMLSLVPRDFLKPPKTYASYLPGDSGIYVDFPSGQGIFRNLSPFVGNPVRLELPDRLAPFPENYQPRMGDRIVIMVMAPALAIREIDFENWKGGLVTAVSEGRAPQPIARVLRPVLGVGRYDATTYTGVGRINTNHCGVITVSTAGLVGALLPEGEGSERRGGIQIEPSVHAEVVSYHAPQVMVVEPLEGQGPLEGQPPLFSGYIGLFWETGKPERSTIAQVKIDNGPWEPMPEAWGRLDDAFTASALNEYFRRRGIERHVTSGITHLRLLFPKLDHAAVTAMLAACDPSNGRAGLPTAGTQAAGGPSPDTPVSGVITLHVALKNVTDNSRISMMTVYVDGKVAAIMNVAPFRHDLDTRQLPNGPHEVVLRALDARGAVVAQKKTIIKVDNPASEANTNTAG